MAWANATSAFRSDYNGFRPGRGGAGQTVYEAKREDWKGFATLADFRAATGQ